MQTPISFTIRGKWGLHSNDCLTSATGTGWIEQLPHLGLLLIGRGNVLLALDFMQLEKLLDSSQEELTCDLENILFRHEFPGRRLLSVAVSPSNAYMAVISRNNDSNMGFIHIYSLLMLLDSKNLEESVVDESSVEIYDDPGCVWRPCRPVFDPSTPYEELCVNNGRNLLFIRVSNNSAVKMPVSMDIIVTQVSWSPSSDRVAVVEGHSVVKVLDQQRQERFVFQPFLDEETSK